MKKVILLGTITLILVAGLFILTGCGNNNSVENQKNSSKKVSDEYSIGNTSLKFNIDKTFKDFNYKVAEGIKVNETKIENKLYYEDKSFFAGDFVFEISMSAINNYSFSEWKYGPKEGEYETIEINGIKWNKYSVASDKYTTENYATDANNSLYVFKISKYNDANFAIDELANVFINGVTFNNN